MAGVQEFVDITGATPAEAVIFLDAAKGDIQAAVQNFFSAHDDEEGELPALVDVPAAGVALSSANAGAASGSRGAPPRAPTTGATNGDKSKGKGKAAPRGAGNVRSLADLRGASDADDDDSDGEGPRESYTGGAKSGMMVQDPKPPRRGGAGDSVDDLFASARAAGALEGNPEDLGGGTKPVGGGAFSGAARTLAGGPRVVEPPPTATPTPAVTHTITFYADGFTVGDGPLRSLSDPANAPFLEAIARGDCPSELMAPRGGMAAPVHVNLVNKSAVKYEPPVAPAYTAYAGTGRTTVSVGGTLAVDATAPSTSLQLRLADGTRMVARFNLRHTVADVRRFVDAERPGQARYRLLTGFPPVELTDPGATIDSAGLKDAVIMQKPA